MNTPILVFDQITKRYPGVTALDHVSMQFYPGEVHAIMGENGAGKSTLIKTASGAIEPDEGSIIINGEKYSKLTIGKAKALGVGVIYQELDLIDSLNIAENIFLGSRIGGKFVINYKEMHQKAQKLLEELGMHFNTHKMVGELSTAQKQMVEIARAMSMNSKILIMDEPSASIGVSDVAKMFEIVKKLKESGVAIIYISHRLEEVFEICDRVSILRDGQYIQTKMISETNRADLINMMVGRELNESFPGRTHSIGEVVLEARNLCGNGDHNINFQLHKGEILGLGGLIGAGRTELAKVIVGDEPVTSGELIVKGEKVHFRSSSDATEKGIGLIPEDRKDEGAFQDYAIDWNLTIMRKKRYGNCGEIQNKNA